MTEYEILKYIKDVKDENGNVVFTPSNDTKLFLVDGQNIEMSCSFYRKVTIGKETICEKFKVRAANHGDWFSRWEDDTNFVPWANKQNLDIVFSPFGITKNNLKCHSFFVIQQYAYDSNTITIKQLKRIINAVLNIGINDFCDPLGTARYKVLRPTDYNDELIPIPANGSVHPHQIEVLREYEESKNRHGTNESSICRVQFDDNIIYKTNMTHIKRLDEMAKSTVGIKRGRRITESRASRRMRMLNENNLFDTIEKYDSDKIDVITALCDGDYSLTLDGLIALYEHFYSNDISFFTEFLGYTGDEKDKWLKDEYEWWGFVKWYVAYKLLEDISIKQVIQAIIDEEYSNYLHPRCDMFDDFEKNDRDDTIKWVEGICAELGIQAPDMED